MRARYFNKVRRRVKTHPAADILPSYVRPAAADRRNPQFAALFRPDRGLLAEGGRGSRRPASSPRGGGGRPAVAAPRRPNPEGRVRIVDATGAPDRLSGDRPIRGLAGVVGVFMMKMVRYSPSTRSIGPAGPDDRGGPRARDRRHPTDPRNFSCGRPKGIVGRESDADDADFQISAQRLAPAIRPRHGANRQNDHRVGPPRAGMTPPRGEEQ
jgi:hypothetical protein